MIPPLVGDIGVDVRTAALLPQLESLGADVELRGVLEAIAKPGLYREPPNLQLRRVKEPMHAIFHVSPDAGFPTLREFIGRIKKRMVATMYEWEATHISDAIEAAIKAGGATASLQMVTQYAGTHAEVDDVLRVLKKKFKHVWASVGAGKLIPKAYHIKVAVRDGEEFWLSSGNWKDSGQPDIDPIADGTTQITPLRKHNREWHAVIENRTLAKIFEGYIKWDFKEAERVPIEEGLLAGVTEFFVPDVAFALAAERPLRARYFEPCVIDRELDIQPLLTPDRDDRGQRMFMKHAIACVQRAQDRVYVQNQSFNLLDENNDEFETFLGVLKEKQDAGLDVRVIFRDAREYGGAAGESQEKILERIKDFGFDTDMVKLQRKLHTKGIVVDGREVILGSHNLTNQGALYNRDASLLVRDQEVAEYFEQIFLFDWETLAAQETEELVGGIRRAAAGETTPPGFRRVTLSELMGED